MDELDELESLDKVDDSGDIKNKILFSVLVVSTITFICICSCDSFKKVVIIYSKWVKRPMITPRESAWRHFVGEKATFCEDERLVWQMIIGRPRDIWDFKKESLWWPRDLYCGDRGCGVLGRVRHRSPPSTLAARSSKRFHVALELVPCFAGPKPKIPFLVVPGLSLLRNPHEKACYAGYSPPSFNFKQEESKLWVRRFSLTCFRC